MSSQTTLHNVNGMCGDVLRVGHDNSTNNYEISISRSIRHIEWKMVPGRLIVVRS